MSARKAPVTDSYRRQKYELPRDLTRAMARDWLKKFPKAAYDTEVAAEALADTLRKIKPWAGTAA